MNKSSDNHELQSDVPPIADSSKKVVYVAILLIVFAGLLWYFAPYFYQGPPNTNMDNEPKWSSRNDPPSIPVIVEPERPEPLEELVPEPILSEEEKEDIWRRLRADPLVIDRRQSSQISNRSQQEQRQAANDRWASSDSNRQFYSDLASSGQPERGYVGFIANKECLLLQGTMLQATSETSASDQLPGQMNAILSFPAYSFDGSTILMPAGTKLMAEINNADKEFGIDRIFTVWTRAVTPEGVDVPLYSVGADQLGGAGLPAAVDYKFWERFGYAGLISLIGAGVDEIDDSRVLRRIARELGNQADDFLNPWTQVPPSRHLAHGSEITIYVSRDIDFCNQG